MNNITKKLSRFEKKMLVILVNLIIPLSGASTNVYIPALPLIGYHFSTATKGFAQALITPYAVGMGFAQFFAGPVSDKVRRQGLIFFSLLIQFFSIILVLLTKSIYCVMLLRFIEGVSAAFMMVPARAIFNDLFSGSELRKQFNKCTINFSLVTIVSPLIGARLAKILGWKAGFVFILFYILTLLFMILMYGQETSAKREEKQKVSVFISYKTMLSNNRFISGAVLTGLVWGYSSLFNLVAPFLVPVAMNRPLYVFSHTASIMAICWFGGNLINRTLFFFNKNAKLKVALWGTFIVTTTMFVRTLMGYFDLPSLIIPVGLIVMLNGLVFPVQVGDCVSIFKHISGSANAFLFGLMWVMFGIFNGIAMLVNSRSIYPIAISYFTLSTISLSVYYVLLRE